MKSFAIEKDRVRDNTPSSSQEKIDNKLRQNIIKYRQASPAVIQQRIVELDKKWDIERTLMLNAALIALIGVALGAFVNLYWLILPAVVCIFLAQHALQGWCPPLPVFRSMGIRSRKELDEEKYTLKEILENRASY